MKKSFAVTLLTLFVGCFLAIGQPDSAPHMKVHFIKVGQADSTLLEFPCGAILIDAGAQDDTFADSLIQYLNHVFQGRPDLHNTLESIMITHPHIDHTYALKRVVETFTVKHYVDNGQTAGSGIANIKWVRSHAVEKHIALREILNSEIIAGGHKNGLTDETIDPLKCDACDPKITIYSGQWDNDPDWTATDLNNKNNHSLVIRVQFGESSFLFSGDMEKPALKTFLDYYGPPANQQKLFHVDVYHVGHHGSDNATTSDLLNALMPGIAVISMGHWDFGKNGGGSFNTWSYGHPRKSTVDLLASQITQTRSTPISVKLATAAKQFSTFAVKKNIYATDWDGNVIIDATTNHMLSISRNN